MYFRIILTIQRPNMYQPDASCKDFYIFDCAQMQGKFFLSVCLQYSLSSCEAGKL
jgi:hypothetical protein